MRERVMYGKRAVPTASEVSLATAIGVAIKNLEASEVAVVAVVQHVIRSLKDALGE